MSPITHFLAGWAVSSPATLNRRERILIALAGVVPDTDGLGAVIDLIVRNKTSPFQYYQQYHHVFGHNIFFGLICSCLAFGLASRKWLVAGLVLLSFHLHLAGDIIGARGQGDDFWPVPYLWPAADLTLVWSRQWPLDGWQNFVITGVLLGLMFFRTWKRGYSPVEIVSVKADRAFVRVLRERFGMPVSAETAVK